MSCFPRFLRFGSKTKFAYFGASHSIRMITTAPTHSGCNSAERVMCCSSWHVLLGRTENMKCDLTTHWTNILLWPCSLLDKPRALQAHEESSSTKLQPSLHISLPYSGFISLQWWTARSSKKRLSSSEPQSGSQVAQRPLFPSLPFHSLLSPPLPAPSQILACAFPGVECFLVSLTFSFSITKGCPHLSSAFPFWA